MIKYLQQCVNRCFSLFSLLFRSSSRVYMSKPYWPSSGKLIKNETTSSSIIVWDTNFESLFSSMPFLCNVAIKSVNGFDIRNCISSSRPVNINASWRGKKHMNHLTRKYSSHYKQNQKLEPFLASIRKNNKMLIISLFFFKWILYINLLIPTSKIEKYQKKPKRYSNKNYQ